MKEYNKFYQTLTDDYGEPLKYKHFSTEGALNFKSLLISTTLRAKR